MSEDQPDPRRLAEEALKQCGDKPRFRIREVCDHEHTWRCRCDACISGACFETEPALARALLAALDENEKLKAANRELLKNKMAPSDWLLKGEDGKRKGYFFSGRDHAEVVEDILGIREYVVEQEERIEELEGALQRLRTYLCQLAGAVEAALSPDKKEK